MAGSPVRRGHFASASSRRAPSRTRRGIRGRLPGSLFSIGQSHDINFNGHVAEQNCAPTDAARRDATAELFNAKGVRSRAARQLEGSGLLGRRAARTELGLANDAVERVENHLHQINRIASEPDKQRSSASGDFRQARDALHSHDLFQRYELAPENLQHIGQGIEALDTWHDWAAGKTLPIDKIAAAVETLDQSTATQPLAAVIAQWAEHHHIQLRTPTRQIEREPIGIEIDL